MFSSATTRHACFTAQARLVSIGFHHPWMDHWFLERGLACVRGEGDVALCESARAFNEALGLRENRQANGALPVAEAHRAYASFLGFVGLLSADLMRRGETRARAVDPRLLAITRALREAPSVRPLEEVWRRDWAVGRRQADRLAREAWGMSLQRWRIRHLRTVVFGRLLEGRQPLKQVAYELGFSDPAHFHHWVRRQWGQGPTALRRRGQRQWM